MPAPPSRGRRQRFGRPPQACRARTRRTERSIAGPAASYRNVVYLLIHLVGSFHDLRIRVISAPAHDHIDEFFDHADIRALDVALHQGSEPFLPSRISDRGISGGVGLCEEV